MVKKSAAFASFCFYSSLTGCRIRRFDRRRYALWFGSLRRLRRQGTVYGTTFQCLYRMLSSSRPLYLFFWWAARPNAGLYACQFSHRSFYLPFELRGVHLTWSIGNTFHCHFPLTWSINERRYCRYTFFWSVLLRKATTFCDLGAYSRKYRIARTCPQARGQQA